jgi:hypothetical protein
MYVAIPGAPQRVYPDPPASAPPPPAPDTSAVNASFAEDVQGVDGYDALGEGRSWALWLNGPPDNSSNGAPALLNYTSLPWNATVAMVTAAVSAYGASVSSARWVEGQTVPKSCSVGFDLGIHEAATSSRPLILGAVPPTSAGGHPLRTTLCAGLKCLHGSIRPPSPHRSQSLSCQPLHLPNPHPQCPTGHACGHPLGDCISIRVHIPLARRLAAIGQRHSRAASSRC